MGLIGDFTHKTRHGGNAGRLGQLLGFDLVAHGGDGFGIGADESDARLGQRFGKGVAFRQKAIAGMHRIGAAAAAGLDDPVHGQIGLGGGRGTDGHRLIRHAHMQGMAVGLGKDRHGGDAHAAGGLDDAAGDFAAIGDQYLAKHRLHQKRAGRNLRGCGGCVNRCTPMEMANIRHVLTLGTRRNLALAVFRVHIENGVSVALGVGLTGLVVGWGGGFAAAVAAATGAVAVSVSDQPDPLRQKPWILGFALVLAIAFTALASFARFYPFSFIAATGFTGLFTGLISAYGSAPSAFP